MRCTRCGRKGSPYFYGPWCLRCLEALCGGKCEACDHLDLSHPLGGECTTCDCPEFESGWDGEITGNPPIGGNCYK